MRQLGSDFIDYLAQLMIDGKLSNKQAMVDGIDNKKISVVRLPDGERAELIAGGTKYVETWVSEATAQGYDGKAMLASYESLIDKYAARRQQKAIRGPADNGSGTRR